MLSGGATFGTLRFLSANRAGAPRWAYSPFVGGQRQCIGHTFAMTEAQFVLAMIAQRFRLSPYSDADVEGTPLGHAGTAETGTDARVTSVTALSRRQPAANVTRSSSGSARLHR